MMTKVKNVDVVNPARMTSPTGAQLPARPSTVPRIPGKIKGATMGNNPRTVVSAVIKIGRNRWVPPRTIASSRGTPCQRR